MIIIRLFKILNFRNFLNSVVIHRSCFTSQNIKANPLRNLLKDNTKGDIFFFSSHSSESTIGVSLGLIDSMPGLELCTPFSFCLFIFFFFLFLECLCERVLGLGLMGKFNQVHTGREKKKEGAVEQKLDHSQDRLHPSLD